MEKDLCVCEMVEVLNLPQARISQHLLRLRSEGIVDDNRESQWVVYSLNKDALKEKMDCLSSFFDSDILKVKYMPDEFDRLNHLECRGTLKEKLACTNSISI
jgi:DNA-binding transcriptional ArsR family regulator